MFRLDGKIAIVTGAASGIGKATAKELAAEGARVVCGDRNEEGLAETVEAIAEAIAEARGQAVGVQCDVTSNEDVAAFVQRALDEYDGLDIVVNVAGIGGFKTPRTWFFLESLNRQPSGKAHYRWAKAKALELDGAAGSEV